MIETINNELDRLIRKGMPRKKALDICSLALILAFVNARFAVASIAMNFIWTPLLAFGLGAIFLCDHHALWIGFGFIMLMVPRAPIGILFLPQLAIP